jgi:hypothetical protein
MYTLHVALCILAQKFDGIFIGSSQLMLAKTIGPLRLQYLSMRVDHFLSKHLVTDIVKYILRFALRIVRREIEQV